MLFEYEVINHAFLEDNEVYLLKKWTQNIYICFAQVSKINVFLFVFQQPQK